MLEQWVIILVLAGLIVCDLAWRRVPNRAIYPALILAPLGAWLGWWSWSWAGAGLGGALVALAGFPWGDVKAVLLLGGLVGVSTTAGTLAWALVLTLVGWHFRLTGVPWLAYVGAGWGLTMVVEKAATGLLWPP